MKEKSTLHELLVFFLKEKNRIIKEITGINLFNDRDYKEVYNLPEKKTLEFLSKLKRYDDDIHICPWCLFHVLTKKTCSKCGYGKRHNRCIDPDSNYTKIINRLKKHNLHSISNIVEIKDLVNLTIDIFNKITINTTQSHEEIILTLLYNKM